MNNREIMSLTDLTEGHDHRPVIDAVLVHGLYEAGLKDWTDDETGTAWMRDLFPYKKYRTRFLSYEYDADRLMAPGGPAASGIYDEAVKLVMELVAERSLQKAMQRPIVFICHGFGGLLVKRALAFSNSRKGTKVEHQRSIILSTYALIFMATPHHGIAKQALLLTQPGNGPSHFLLGLLEGSETLAEINDQFAPLMKMFLIYNFWEQLETNLGQESTMIVERTSAAPPEWSDVDKCGVYATHSRIVKFSNENLPGYRLIFAALDRSISKAVDDINRRWQHDKEILQQELIHQLRSIESNIHAQSTMPSRFPSTTAFASGHNSAPLQRHSHGQLNGRRPSYINLHYLVSRRSEFFVGRQKEAEDLRARLGTDRGKTPKVCVIYGLSGSGKTQFCLKFAEDNRQRYWGVFWIDASSEANADNSLSALSHRAGKGGEPGAALEWLSQTFEPWLLVLDNANDPDMDLPRLLPAAGNGHILVTTRNPNTQIYGTVLPFQFKGMDPEDAITLFLRLAYPEKELHFTSQVNRELAEVVVSELGYLALAIKQAAATIRRNFLPLERYLNPLLGCRKTLLRRPTIGNSTDANIIATWELPFTGITNRATPECQDAVNLVHILAFMHFNSVPADVFSRSSDGVREMGLSIRLPAIFEPRSNQGVKERVLAAARVLYDHSIMSLTELREGSEDAQSTRAPAQYFSLHPAIHQWARERLDESQQREWLECAAAILAHSISSSLETSGRVFRRQLLPHIESCVSLLEGAFSVLPYTLDYAFNLEKFGLVYAENGLWKRARALQMKVMSIRSEKLGKSHMDTINSQRVLADTYWNLFEIKQCLKVQHDILNKQRWSRPSIRYWLTWPPWKPSHIPYCETLDSLTRSLWLAGFRELSRITGEAAVKKLTKHLGREDPITLSAMFNLARTYLHLEEHAKSYDLLIHVLQKRMHFFGPDHPDTLMVRNELGMNLCAQKIRLDEAEQHVQSTLDTRKRVLGEEHAYTLWSVNDLSKLYCELRRFDEAARVLEEIAPIVSRTLGDNHVGMIMTKSNLCRAYAYCEKLDEAGNLIRQLCDIVPPDSPEWIHAQWGYACILVLEGKLDEAVLRCDRLLAIMSEKKVLKPDNPRVIAIVKVLCTIFQRQNREQEIVLLKKTYPRLDDKDVMNCVEHMPLGLLQRWLTQS